MHGNKLMSHSNAGAVCSGDGTLNNLEIVEQRAELVRNLLHLSRHCCGGGQSIVHLEEVAATQSSQISNSARPGGPRQPNFDSMLQLSTMDGCVENCDEEEVAAPRRGICAVSAEQEVASPTFIREHCTAEGSMSPETIREVRWEARAPKAGVVATQRLAAMRQQHSERRSIAIGIVCGCGPVKSTGSVSH